MVSNAVPASPESATELSVAALSHSVAAFPLLGTSREAPEQSVGSWEEAFWDSNWVARVEQLQQTDPLTALCPVPELNASLRSLHH